MSRDDPDTPRLFDCLRAILYACLCVSTVACFPPPTAGVPPDASLVAPKEARILSESYPEWRARLRDQAARWQAQEPRTEFGTLPLQVTEEQTGPTESLGVDYLYLPPLDLPTNLIVMISGIHGVEAPAGVLFQNVVLDHCVGSAIDRTRTGLLVVHVMNPFGPKHGRRFNSNNVDLNRNFFGADFNDGETFRGRRERNDEYESVKALLEDRRIGFFDVSFQYISDFFRGRSETLQRALRGQYQSPKGIYFGGREVEPEGLDHKTAHHPLPPGAACAGRT